MLRIGFIGAGIVGTALALQLSKKGYKVVAVASRSVVSAQRLAGEIVGCEVYEDAQSVANAVPFIFITTPDDVIGKVAAEVHWHSGHNVVHCSGAHSLDVLEPARQSGAKVGGLHPLQTFASINQAINNLAGSLFVLEAEQPLLTTLKQLATALGGNWVVLKPGNKALYHAAAVFSCNYLVTLVKLATDLWQIFGVSATEATKALLPLLQGTIKNIESVGLPHCLTGPIARGDVDTITKHLAALEKAAPSLLTTYRELGLQTIPIALAKGKVDKGTAEKLHSLLRTH